MGGTSVIKCHNGQMEDALTPNEPQVANSANDARVLRTAASITERRICEVGSTKKRKNTVFPGHIVHSVLARVAVGRPSSSFAGASSILGCLAPCSRAPAQCYEAPASPFVLVGNRRVKENLSDRPPPAPQAGLSPPCLRPLPL